MSDTLRYPRTPFLTVESFTNTLEAIPETSPVSETPNRPFLSLYEEEGGVRVADLQTDEYLGFLSELYQEEMDEAFLQLAGEISHLHRGLEQETGRASDSPTAERMVEQHVDPLSQEIERLLESIANEYGEREASTLTEDEVDRFIDRQVPSSDLAPEFEEFFGKIGRFFKKVARGAIGLAKKGIGFIGKIALGPLFRALRRLVRPLLRRVLRFAMGRLPRALQPIAGQLARRLGVQEFEDREDLEDREDREGIADVRLATDPGEIQQEFNRQIADFLFAENEVQQEAHVERAAVETMSFEDRSATELEDAREALVERLQALRPGEDPTPHLEEFVPVVLGALRLGVRVVGRKRVVRFLARLLSRLVSRFVGPQHAPALSQAIVDAGLRLVQLEASPRDEARAAGQAVASTVEETVRRVAGLPDEVLDREDLLEAFALEAFEQAAAANLPPMLTEEVYRSRPELRETRILRGTWLLMPLRGRKRYKKYSQIVRTRITPQQASEIQGFEGVPLSETLEEQLGLAPGADVEAEIHLYETIPSSNLATVASHERDVLGSGASAEIPGGLQPLTPEAAGLLLQEPGLGRELPQESESGLNVRPGQRLFALRIPGLRAPLAAGAARVTRLRRTSRVKIALDLRAGQVRVHLYLSEKRCQEIAERLRQKLPTGAILTLLRRLLHRRLRRIGLGRMRGLLRIVHESAPTQQFAANAFRRLPLGFVGSYASRIQGWILPGLDSFFTKQADAFIAASQDPADGVTLAVTIQNPPNLSALRAALQGRTPQANSTNGTTPNVSVTVQPGYVRA